MFLWPDMSVFAELLSMAVMIYHYSVSRAVRENLHPTVQEESSGSSEGHDTSIGYESEMRSDVESGVQASIK